MGRFLLSFFVFLIFLSNHSFAADGKVLELNAADKSFGIANHIKICTDINCQNEIPISSLTSEGDSIFLKLEVLNNTNSVRWIIGFGNSNEKITLYTIKNNVVTDTFYCGTNYTLLQKAIKTGVGEFMVFNLTPNEKTTFLLKLENKSSFSKHLLKYSISEAKIFHPESYQGNRAVSKAINIFFYGAIILMIFYNLMLAITLNSRGYAYYVSFSLLFLFYNFVSDGLIREAFFPNTTNHFHFIRLVITPLMLVVYIQFGRIYMQTSYLVSKADKNAKYLMLLLLISYVPMFFGEWWLARLTLLILSIVTVFFMTIVTVMCVVKNYFPARYFLVGNIILIVTGFTYVAYLLDFIPHTTDTKILEFLPQIGAIFDLALFSLGLANRIQVIEQELVKNEIEAEHEKQSLIEEKNQELENRVKQRTEELISQKEEIAAINEELEEKVRERTKKLQKAYRDLLNLNYELDTFIYRAAHDITGPITTIMGLCNLALIEKDPKKSHDYLLVLEKFSKNTQFTLNRILSVNEIKNNHIKPDYFQLAALRDGVLELMKENPNTPKVTISFDMDENETVYYDFNLLQLIVHNLVDNAVRFRSNELVYNPLCEIKIYKSEEETLIIQVHDNGQGIDDTIKDKVFDMFFRGNEYSSGSGLGLYIAKLAAKKLSGDVSLIHSKRGDTLFEIHLGKLKERRIQFTSES